MISNGRISVPAGLSASVEALAFFVLAQRRIVGGLSGLAGSIKG
jgi:hypothetical protein